MTQLDTMYAPQANSPATTITGALSIGTVQFDVLDASVLPDPPMLLVIGSDSQNAETVLMTAKNGSTLTVTRAVQGIARSWPAGIQIARLFTALDHSALINNINALDRDKAPKSTDNFAITDTTWTGDSSPYTQTVAVAGLAADAQITVGLAANITAEQYAAALAANLMCTAQAAGSITLTAFGEAPTVAIPILVRVVG